MIFRRARKHAGGASTIDTIARGLAGGMSRREALTAGGAALVGVVTMSPTDALAKATGHCPKGRLVCNGKCCPAGQRCITLPHKKGKKAKRGCGCPAHTVLCRGKCVNFASDVRNCGRCGHACARGQVCARGVCSKTCPAGTTACAGGCVALATDPRNCGKCGTACGAGKLLLKRHVCELVCCRPHRLQWRVHQLHDRP